MKGNLKATKLLKNSNVPERAIWWYTKDSFLYRLFNKAFRHQAESLICLMHFFIADLYKQLKGECATQAHNDVCTYYRGQLILKEEIAKLHYSRSSSDPIIVNSFLSVTDDRDMALIFAGAGSHSQLDDTQSVLFEITIDKMDVEKPFANIRHLSSNSDENETLFSAGSIFSIRNIEYNNDEQVWIVKLLCQHSIDIYTRHYHHYNLLKAQSIDIPLIKLTCFLQKMDITHDQENLKLPCSDEVQIMHCYNKLVNGLSGLPSETCFISDYDSLRPSDSQLKIIVQKLKCNYSSLPHAFENPYGRLLLYDNLGALFKITGKLTEASNWFIKAAELQLNMDYIDGEAAFKRCFSLACIHRKMGNYMIAWDICKILLKYDPQPFDIYAQIAHDDPKFVELSTKDLPEYVDTIIEAYRKMSWDNECSVVYLEKALALTITYQPNNKYGIRVTYESIAAEYEKNMDYNSAIQCLKKLVNFFKYEYTNKEDEVLKTYLKIGKMYGEINDYQSAFEYLNKSLTAWMDSENGDASAKNLTTCYQYYADVYMKKEDFNEAIEWNGKGLMVWIKRREYATNEVEFLKIDQEIDTFRERIIQIARQQVTLQAAEQIANLLAFIPTACIETAKQTVTMEESKVVMGEHVLQPKTE